MDNAITFWPKINYVALHTAGCFMNAVINNAKCVVRVFAARAKGYRIWAYYSVAVAYASDEVFDRVRVIHRGINLAWGLSAMCMAVSFPDK